ncbi:MAG: hypothetical protein AB3N33_08930, partial [Puniceicoccaceae bacterium]
KKTAFLQALVIVILLTASWFLSLTRKRSVDAPVSEEPASPTPTPIEESLPDETPAEPEVVEQVAADEPAPAGTTVSNLGAVPPLWVDWINYLQQQSTPEDLRNAIMAMREAVFSMEQADASARLIELIISRVDIPTGMAFQVGPGGNLEGGPSLQVLLADWLGQIDPERAAGLARLALTGGGTGLGQDLYVIHMRNFARGTPDGEDRGNFLKGHFRILLGHQPWIDDPGSAFAEAMDVAVYLEDPLLVPEIASLTTGDKAPRLRHASSLALERMIDQAPVDAISQLLSSPEGQAMNPSARAGFVARLDPVTPAGQALLKDYLVSPQTSREEAERFLAHFPNMNQSLSHNLLSTNFSNTESTGHMERLQRALETVRKWEADPDLAELGDSLNVAATRLSAQVSPLPQP